MKAIFLLLCFYVVAATLPCAAKPYAFLENGIVKIGNDEIERAFAFNGGNLKTLWILNKKSGGKLVSSGKLCDISVPSESGAPVGGYFKTRDVPSGEIRVGWLECETGFSKGGVSVKRVFKIFEKSPAIACETFFKGSPKASSWIGSRENSVDKKNIETRKFAAGSAPILSLDSFDFSGRHWRLLAVEFFDATDHTNNFVSERETLSYRKNSSRGNLLFIENSETFDGVFWLKESPCSSAQLAYPDADFISEFGKFTLVGAGLDAPDISPDNWTRAYGYVFGVWRGGEFGRISALRAYQKNLRFIKEGRDEMVMVNTWGDRGQDTKVTADFCLSEIARAAKIGATHFQIDDGWQSGKSGNSAYGGSFKDIWSNPEYWTPSKTKYPRGLSVVADAAKAAGIELCLWFNPSVQNDFADWRKDVDALCKLYDDYGIRTFKIDGLKIPNKLSEERVRAIFDSVLERTKNRAVFNLDVTAGRRGGYFMFNQYGNIFLENRYTDWRNYYPFWTLRNLWSISKYVPAERLQIEFLNNARNADKYGGDIFAPSKYDTEYLFAVAMAAQPLAWFEATGLSETQVEKLGKVVRDYRKFSYDFHSGAIFPIGDEPSGRSWTGFRSIISPESGYVIAYRELNDLPTKSMRAFFKSGSSVKFEPLAGDARAFSARADSDGAVVFSLPNKNSFGVWRYKIEK